MAKTYCRLDNGDVVRYSAAFSLDSITEASPELIYLGVGVIIYVGPDRYYGKTRLKFYTTKKRVKYNGKRRS